MGVDVFKKLLSRNVGANRLTQICAWRHGNVVESKTECVIRERVMVQRNPDLLTKSARFKLICTRYTPKRKTMIYTLYRSTWIELIKANLQIYWCPECKSNWMERKELQRFNWQNTLEGVNLKACYMHPPETKSLDILQLYPSLWGISYLQIPCTHIKFHSSFVFPMQVNGRLMVHSWEWLQSCRLERNDLILMLS